MEARRQWREVFKRSERKQFHRDKKVKSLEEVTILKGHEPSNIASKYVIQKMTRIKKLDKCTVIVVG